MSPSGLKFPKLHSWVYHIIDSIRSFGAVNGYTTETYESLHKEYVKIPYRLSNKKNIEAQIMQTVSIKCYNITQYYATYKHNFTDSTAINYKINSSINKFTDRSSCICILSKTFLYISIKKCKDLF
jgi:hypothetical protein